MYVGYHETVILFYFVISITLHVCVDVIKVNNNDADFGGKDIIEALGMILPYHFQNRINCAVHHGNSANNSFINQKETCEYTSSKVFNSRKRELNKARKHILQQSNRHYDYNDYGTDLFEIKKVSNFSTYSNVHYRKSRHRVKRDRTLLAVQGEPKNNRLWPKWCKKLAYFRVFQYDYTLCLYINDFKNDPILAYSDPHIGVTSYGYGSSKSFDKIGKF